ncbi:MAG: hypothetical protein IPM93_21705 [Candidatus Obscuribacter sp.]|nr:hypothetical protein [Candidatus Obscuribacter sp.]
MPAWAFSCPVWCRRPHLPGCAPTSLHNFLRQPDPEFAPIWNLQLHRRRKRPWQDIHSVQIVYPEAAATCTFPNFAGEKINWRQFLQTGGIGPRLVFDFKSGGSATLHLSLLSRAQAEELFAAIDKFGDQSKLSSDFVKLQKGHRA